MNIAIATSFSSWGHGYSLGHVAVAQANAFTALGHNVQLWGESSLPENPAICGATVLPAFSLHEYRPDDAQNEAVLAKFQEFLALLDGFRPDLVISHDLIFQAPFIAYAEAIHQLPAASDQVWFHLTHSNVIPGPFGDGARCRRTVPEGHYLLALGESHRRRIAQYYQRPLDDVFVCPNPHPMLDRTTPDGARLINELRLMERDLVQVYPLCGSRLADKGTRWLIDIFEALKARGQNVCLVIPNASSDTDEIRDTISRDFSSASLTSDELVFTSLRWPEWEKGVPHDIVADLVRFSNLFVFPSRTEACSLALAEAQAAGCFCVLNDNCTAQMDYRHQQAMTFPFDGVDFEVHFHTTDTSGSKPRELNEQESRQAELDKLADRIISNVEQNQSLMARRHAMRTYWPEAVAQRIIDHAAVARSRT